MKTLPFETEGLCVTSLGKIVTDSEYFHDEQYIWPEVYTAERKFISTTDPSIKVSYKMEVLRDSDSKFRPLFKVTTENAE
ncbi:Histone-lysine n-methyltransferase trx1 [Thalictrum thalictroides]|uniref:Histone-lysine n-methyltransferase trx1 n=1 Tax=Thalictrum thalictroides TaxID=46969 RepID=A0A7J6XEZ8_THATH|nr:Histone-lysine n-methyltransferase trx1 [Thalictrum thalictroides]